MNKHTPEPWCPDGERLKTTAGRTIADFRFIHGGPDACNRAASAVNALRGLNPAALAEVLAAAGRVVNRSDPLAIADLRAALAKLREVKP